MSRKKAKKQLTDAELAAIMEFEILAEMVVDDISPEEIADPETRRLWESGRSALVAIRQRLNAAWVDTDDDDD